MDFRDYIIKLAFTDPSMMAAGAPMPPAGAPMGMPPAGMPPAGAPMPDPSMMANMPLDPTLMAQMGAVPPEDINPDEIIQQEEQKTKTLKQLEERVKTLESSLNIITKKLDTIMDMLENYADTKAQPMPKQGSAKRRKTYSDIIDRLLNEQ